MPRPACSVKYCLSNKKGSLHDVTVHKFPACESLRKQWVAWVQRINVVGQFKINSRSSLCSAHFDKEYFMPSGRLKRDAIPSIVPPLDPATAFKLGIISHVQEPLPDVSGGGFDENTSSSTDTAEESLEYMDRMVTFPSDQNTLNFGQMCTSQDQIISQSSSSSATSLDNENTFILGVSPDTFQVPEVAVSEINAEPVTRSVLSRKVTFAPGTSSDNNTIPSIVKVESLQSKSVQIHQGNEEYIVPEDIPSNPDPLDISSEIDTESDNDNKNVTVRGKRTSFIGDLSIEDFQTPERARHSLSIIKTKFKKQQCTIQVLRQSLKRAERRIQDLTALLGDCHPGNVGVNNSVKQENEDKS